LAGHDLARINQFWGHYKSGNLQFLKSRSHIFYSLWKAWPVFARSGAAGSLNVAPSLEVRPFLQLWQWKMRSANQAEATFG